MNKKFKIVKAPVWDGTKFVNVDVCTNCKQIITKVNTSGVHLDVCVGLDVYELNDDFVYEYEVGENK